MIAKRSTVWLDYLRDAFFFFFFCGTRVVEENSRMTKTYCNVLVCTLSLISGRLGKNNNNKKQIKLLYRKKEKQFVYTVNATSGDVDFGVALIMVRLLYKLCGVFLTYY